MERGTDLNIKAYSDGKQFVRVSISAANEVKECPPVDLFCCVDVSGSMGQSCAGKTDGRTEYIENGFSLMDLVKHALKTIIQSLRPQDRLTIITFNNMAKNTDVNLSHMNEQGKEVAMIVADQLIASGGTNMQRAINYTILEVLNRADKSYNPAILFFTDGQSQVELKEF